MDRKIKDIVISILERDFRIKKVEEKINKDPYFFGEELTLYPRDMLVLIQKMKKEYNIYIDNIAIQNGDINNLKGLILASSIEEGREAHE